MIKIKYILITLLVLRVAAPVSLAGYMWMKNRGKDVSLNFEKIVRGGLAVSVPGETPRMALVHAYCQEYLYLTCGDSQSFTGVR